MKMFRTKSEIYDLKCKLKRLDEEVCCLRDENSKLSRIIQNHVHGEITAVPYDERARGYCICIFSSFGTTLYKDGKEYDIKRLELNKPIFSVSPANKNIILVADVIENEDTCLREDVEYAIDLENCTFIRIK